MYAMPPDSGRCLTWLPLGVLLNTTAVLQEIGGIVTQDISVITPAVAVRAEGDVDHSVQQQQSPDADVAWSALKSGAEMAAGPPNFSRPVVISRACNAWAGPRASFASTYNVPLFKSITE